MSVFSLEAAKGNPVTSKTVDELCSQLGVSIKDSETEAYTRLLAVFHDASKELMAMDGKVMCMHIANANAFRTVADLYIKIMFRQLIKNVFQERTSTSLKSRRTRMAPGHGNVES